MQPWQSYVVLAPCCMLQAINHRNTVERGQPMYQRLILIGVICLALLGLRETGAQGAEEQCFEQTRACVGGRFLAYWKENGDLPVFGLAIWPSQNELNADT